jgi:hypothetical protein
MIGGFGDSFGDPNERSHPLVNMIFLALLRGVRTIRLQFPIARTPLNIG